MRSCCCSTTRTGVIAQHGRAVVLTPDTRTAEAFVTDRLPAGYQVLSADDVEYDLKVFTRQPAAALVLTNRYDGIDLPDDDCRLVVLAGLPARGDLQERFLHGSLGAVEVLQERIRPGSCKAPAGPPVTRVTSPPCCCSTTI